MKPFGLAASISITVTAAAKLSCKDQKGSPITRGGFNHTISVWVTNMTSIFSSPDYDNDAVKAVVRVLDVAKKPESQELEQHFEAEETGEDHITDLQNVCQLLWLKRVGVCRERRGVGV